MLFSAVRAWLWAFSRLLLGGTFLLSGFVKVVDPMGMVHKLYAYAAYAQLHLTDGGLMLQFASVALGTLEFMLGVYILLGLHRRLASRLAVGFMAAFTAVTVWIYLTNPVPDCGCFGDAIELTAGQTLAKNVLLLVAAVYWMAGDFRRFSGSGILGPLFRRRLISDRNSWVVSIYAWCYAIGLALYTLHYLPLLDFTPYKQGADIRAALEGRVEDAEGSKLANFYLSDLQTGEDITFAVVADTGYVFLLTVPDALAADDGCNDRINDLYDFCLDKGYRFLMATASDSAGAADWCDRTGAAYPMVMAEDTELKAMVRSNPGLLLLHDGKVAGKWSNNDLPDVDSGKDAVLRSGAGRGAGLPWLVFWFVVPLLVVITADSLWIGHKFYKHHIYVKRFKLKKIMRKKIVAGNWKMNKNLQEGVALAKDLNEALVADKPNCDVVICTPFIHLASVASIIDPTLIGLGAENCADKVSGAYTGEVSAEMVKSTGAGYVILGHSERRAYYHETPEILKEKVNLALANDLKVIFCIGEVLEEREAGKQNEVVKAQLEGSLFDLTAEQFAHIILAYEHVWAIGTGKTATADQAEEMHAFIRETIAEKFGAEAAENVSILYGGSCKPSNAKEIFSKVDVDGGLIGGAALKVADFKGIIDAWKEN